MLAVLTVNSNLDYTSAGDARVTLREAIVAANTGGTTDLGETAGSDNTIVFDASLDGDTILLDGTQITISRELTIDASSLDDNIIVDAGHQSRIFDITPGARNVSIIGLTLIDGATVNNNLSGANTYNGGAIRSLASGVLTLERSTISGSHTEGNGAEGGAIFATGAVSLIDSTISNNYTLGFTAFGGGIRSDYFVTLTNSTVTDNYTQDTNSRGGGISAGLDIVLNDSTVSNNHTEGGGAAGGGMFLGRHLTLTRSTISGNYTQGGNAPGGGFYAFGDLQTLSGTISNNHTEENFSPGGGGWLSGSAVIEVSTLSDNYTLDNDSNGGGLVVGSTLQFVASTASGNYTSGDLSRGGGIYADGNVDFSGSTIDENHTEGAVSFGGGVFAAAQVTLTNSTLSDNYTLGIAARGGGLWAQDDVTLSESSLMGNYTVGDEAYGGGIRSHDVVSLTDSTLSGNHTEGVSSFGGGIDNTGIVTVTQSTVSSNYTLGNNASGGGIRTEGDVVIIYSTVTDNFVNHPSAVGGGLWHGATPVFIIGSIVAANTAAGGNPDLLPGAGTLTVQYSLIGDNAGTSLVEAQTPDANGNLIGSSDGGGAIDPLLGPLADNGGPTRTHLPLAGSPAIDANDPTLIAGVGDVSDFDQRGDPYGRVLDGDGIDGERMDMGAVEAQFVESDFVLLGDYNLDGCVDAADYTVWRNSMDDVVPARSGADGNGNGVIDEGDYDMWREHFGETMPVQAAGGGASASQEETANVEETIEPEVAPASVVTTDGSAVLEEPAPPSSTFIERTLEPSVFVAAEEPSPAVAASGQQAEAATADSTTGNSTARFQLDSNEGTVIIATPDSSRVALSSSRHSPHYHHGWMHARHQERMMAALLSTLDHDGKDRDASEAPWESPTSEAEEPCGAFADAADSVFEKLGASRVARF